MVHWAHFLWQRNPLRSSEVPRHRVHSEPLTLKAVGELLVQCHCQQNVRDIRSQGTGSNSASNSGLHEHGMR